MWTKLIILTLFAVSALLAVTWHGMKTTDLDDITQDTLQVGEVADHRSVSLRGRRALGLSWNNAFDIVVRTDVSHPKVSYVTSECSLNRAAFMQ